jgi:hypothetical protein
MVLGISSIQLMFSLCHVVIAQVIADVSQVNQ